ncbi:hypothetical protein COW36_12375 [bacterium (Candidatus Blackallbacteria) CG17_big_fil_post_rev_8_21_14_2_50_48_46]|uniref:Mannosyl-glycoprotein endo-beta-N-acetylglucosamidase-like domain-containing protein n=1 Tax=bacterium (Candidatus Blackallbacteria) CG17_big_fil_post_rev_8_21_14_2_50_48_46 TaxID=2014261 RepID=A0A2M7G3V2_9BACT|nr:MAG: hypothetical protein COW64_02885 [bacterium (Candidatus Blackallbacteria) CG18_big_fil_WC_8_21_14_2_50_49_26]PIW16556.1 MAG: hypothetical protein COW36_12375 [bacterium (Candidatus Blackallbacteria) CG17_big_fil_post_rev_8_21_14_2_50_48_46]PIW46064.1 MAG: hypothetical protein COW20_17640 [bacterium (Candidatus Blackallbacteria) CG13_big_fil_rev_8_21_14_2_50_49_14]
MQLNSLVSLAPDLLLDPRRLFQLPQAKKNTIQTQSSPPQAFAPFVLAPMLQQGQAATSLNLFPAEATELSLDQIRAGSIAGVGSKGAAVRWLQENLTKLGYAVQITAELGPTTESRLQKFQKDYGVQSTGKFGPTTLKAVEWAIQQTHAIQALRKVSPSQLKKMDASQFFKTLLPAALESERVYHVPAAVTLAQAALESGFAASPIGGYNIFGIKGRGPAGSVMVGTTEYYGGKKTAIQDRFAKYHDFYEAVSAHGKLFHNGYYDKAVTQFAKDQNTHRFIDNMAKTYATDPQYASKLKSMIQQYGLEILVNSARKIPTV